ncbi:MAG: TIGR04211 family SH3 domain-containing protein [Gammaproteobacteria bacterium]|nr:TIGR04211 family SH3 domain-containing protein [Gammaproteobacteria bacterium]
MITRLLGVALMMVAATAVGQTLYVSDQLVITVRTGPSTENSIITNLVTGDAVEVLQANAETGYTRVRIQSGVEGWVLGRYLVATPVSQDRLIIAESDLAEAQATVATLEGSVAMLAAELEVTGRRLEETETENASLTKELADLRAASENVLSIRDQNESLRRRLNERNEEAELLAIDNDRLRNRATRDWFVAGAGVLLAGIIVGIIAPRLRRRRRSQW